MNETRFASVLGQARELGRAVGAFTCYNLEQLEAVIEAAESRNAPTIILISSSSFKSNGGERLAMGFRTMVADARVEILVQLDHVSDLEWIERAADCGVDAVMADGSKMSYEKNLDFTSAVVGSMHNRGVAVEAELGRIEGHEDRAGKARSGAMTEPGEAEHFARESGVDCLAVSVGNVHGHYDGTPSLDWKRLQEIQDSTPTRLSLHGASGLADRDLHRALSSGISKINVNTELRAAYMDLLEKEIGGVSTSLDIKSLNDRLTNAVGAVVENKLSTLGWPARKEIKQ